MTSNFEVKNVDICEMFGFSDYPKGLPKVLPKKVSKDGSPLPFVPKEQFHVFPEAQLRRVLLKFVRRKSIMLMGPKGSGKSSMVEQINARFGNGLMTINCGPGVDNDYLMGRPSIKDGSVKDMLGSVTFALKHGLNICFDEVSALRPAEQVAINDVLAGNQTIQLRHIGFDPDSPLELAAVESQIIRHDSTRIWATDNTGGKSGRNSDYSGLSTMNAATRSRLTYFNVGYMDAETELKALKHTISKNGKCAINDTTLKCMVALCNDIRSGYISNECRDTISFRELLNWAESYIDYDDIDEAFADSIFTAAEEVSREFMLTAFKANMGKELDVPDDLKDVKGYEDVEW